MRTWAKHSLAILESEKSSGILLLLCAVVSLVLTNWSATSGYQALWHHQIFSKSLEYWINDGLMAVFFLSVGLEIEREIYAGELNTLKKSVLPIVAAVGGMTLPALIHAALNYGTPTATGFGIPMATDIAFSLGLLSLLGNRVPFVAKIFLTALAIIDDLGAIIVIAVFYSQQILFWYLALALLVVLALLVLNFFKVKYILPYLLLGVVLWYCLGKSGIHATIAGVILAFTIPFGKGDDQSTSSILQHGLHKWVSFFILPLFALANTAIVIPSSVWSDFFSVNNAGIMLGLVIGKPLGVFLFCWAVVKLSWAQLPHHLSLKHLFAIGILAGIGFTMSIFISMLAFNNSELINSSKLAVLGGSVISGVIGMFVLYFIYHKK